jgi:hypothetical protein
MSRNTVIVLVVLCVGVGVLIAFSKKRSGTGAQSSQVAQNTDVQPATPAGNPITPGSQTGNPPPDTTATTRPGTEQVTPTPGNATVGRSTVATVGTPGNPTAHMPWTNRPGITPPAISRADTNDLPEVRPLPVLEKDYASATNRDSRLDIMMDIAETPGAESVRALTRLFEIETDGDLKVDLLDSLLGMEGFKEEKLIMLTMGARQGLPQEVRQSAIDGLIDLDDPRVFPVLN